MLQLFGLQTGFTTHGKKRQVLASGLDFSAIRGELTAVIGPNGVGKSTLLHTLVRLHPRLGGKVEIDHQNIDRYTLTEFALTCSFVPAGRMPLSKLTVEEVTSLARYPHTGWLGKLNAGDAEAIDTALEALHLQAVRQRPVDELSDGEQQRVWIARALAQGTPMVVMDEPTAFLDIPNRYDIYRYLKEIAVTQQRLILFASHDLEFVLGMADKIWLLLSGESYEGAPEDLLARGLLDKLFHTSGITFDPEKGLVFPAGTSKSTYYLSGDKRKTAWIRKALNRAGFGGSDDPKERIKGEIREEHNEIILKKNDTEIRFSSVYALLLFLKKNNHP